MDRLQNLARRNPHLQPFDIQRRAENRLWLITNTGPSLRLTITSPSFKAWSSRQAKFCLASECVYSFISTTGLYYKSPPRSDRLSSSALTSDKPLLNLYLLTPYAKGVRFGKIGPR